MGVHSNSSIKIMKQHRSVASTNVLPQPVKTRLEIMQERVDGFKEFDFDLKPNQASRRPLENLVRKAIQNAQIFTKKELENGLIFSFKSNPTLSKWNTPETWTGTVEFEIYPKGKKKEGIVRGSFSHKPVMARKYPKYYSYHMNKLMLDNEKAVKAKHTVKKMTEQEERGWEKLLNFKGKPIDISDKFLSTRIWISGGEMKKLVIEKLCQDYLGTDGSEIQAPGSAIKHYSGKQGKTSTGEYQYGYDWEFDIFRSYHRADTQIRLKIEQLVISTAASKKYDVKVLITGIEKV